MNTRKEKGSIRSRLLIALPVLVLLGYLGVVWAQVADPCAIYPKQSVNVPVGTPTAKLITGVLGKQIYICNVTVDQLPGAGGSPAPPGLTLSYGEVVAATPCATATPGATLGVFGGTGQTVVGPGSTTILGPVPAAAGTPVVDVCGVVTSGNGIVGGSLTYVQVP